MRIICYAQGVNAKVECGSENNRAYRGMLPAPRSFPGSHTTLLCPMMIWFFSIPLSTITTTIYYYHEPEMRNASMTTRPLTCLSYTRVLSFASGHVPLLATRTACLAKRRSRSISGSNNNTQQLLAAALSLTSCTSRSNSRVQNKFCYQYFGTSSKNKDDAVSLSSESSSSSSAAAAAAELSDDEILERYRKYVESSEDDSIGLQERLQCVEDILHKSVSEQKYNPRQKYRGRDYIYFLMRKLAPSKNKRRRINKQSAQARLDELIYTRHALRHGKPKLKLLHFKALSESFLGPACKEQVTLAMAKKFLKEQWRWGRSVWLEDLKQKVAERRARTKFIGERTALNRKRKQQQRQRQEQQQKVVSEQKVAEQKVRRKFREEGATANKERWRRRQRRQKQQQQQQHGLEEQVAEWKALQRKLHEERTAANREQRRRQRRQEQQKDLERKVAAEKNDAIGWIVVVFLFTCYIFITVV